MTTKLKQNDFRDKTKIAVITNVDPQNKTVDIRYTSQSGEYKNLKLPYQVTGLTWGLMYMPVKGDKVLIDDTQGGRPIIKSMYPTNTDYLPYLDPGEMAVLSENGSYVLTRNKRKRIKSTGELIDYDADAGPKGEKDIEYEPGGVIIRARSKQNRDGVQPKWDNHGYMYICDNGDIVLQSMYKGKHKGMLFLDGSKGYVYLGAGDSHVQEYFEMNPLTKEMVLFTDGDEHHHVQKDLKHNIYGNDLENVGGMVQSNVGFPINATNFPTDFKKVKPDSDMKVGDVRVRQVGSQTHIVGEHFELQLGVDATSASASSDLSQGDISIDSTKSSSGKFTLHVKGNINITVDSGDVNVTASAGDVYINSDASDGKNIYLNGGSGETDRIATIKDIQDHTHAGVSPSGGISGGKGTYTGTGKAYLGQ